MILPCNMLRVYKKTETDLPTSLGIILFVTSVILLVMNVRYELCLVVFEAETKRNKIFLKFLEILKHRQIFNILEDCEFFI